MANEVFELNAVTRVFADGVELAEALGFPEISALGDNERRWRTTLETKAKSILEDPLVSPAIQLHRRRAATKIELDEVELTLEPLSRAPDWQEPARVRFGFVRWAEGGELFQAFVPALGIQVFASRENLLRERVEKHIRLLLLGRRKRLGLAELAGLAGMAELKLGRAEAGANLKTPKQLAAHAETTRDEPSVLDKIAEELPPVIPRDSERAAEKTKSRKAALAPEPAAFEMEIELRTLADSLTGPHRRTVLLVGSPGCGKTALIRELARRRAEFGFAQTPFWSTSGPRLMTGPIGFGMWQERCQQMWSEAVKTRSILHLGQLSELLEVGRANRGQQSVGNFLRPWIARGELPVIAECAPEQLGAIEREDPHLLGAFSQLNVPDRTPEQTRAILGKVFDAAAGKAAAGTAAAAGIALDRLHLLHLRYATYSANPGRAVGFLRNLLCDRLPDKNLAEAGVIEAFSQQTGLPPMLLDDRIPLDLAGTNQWFARRVIGQPEAVECVINLLAMVKARLARPRKPLASFLFIGPTGTGKTELAKALAQFFFGNTSRLARFDLNQFNDAVSVQRLIGGPATGDTEGLLTARIREQPFSVLLLDEFEKADPGFFDLLLQILGDGRLTDAAGRVADFSNSIVVMTSNLGAQGFQRGAAGFRADGAITPHAREHFTAAVQKFLRPEIFNRLDAVVPFQPLPQEIVLSIAEKQINLIRQRDGLRLRPVQLSLPTEVGDHLARGGYDVRYGARTLKRSLERELLAPLAEALNRYAENLPLNAQVGVVDGLIKVAVKAKDSSGPQKIEVTAELPGAIVAQRRRLGRLKNCSATASLENQVTLIRAMERRLTAKKWRGPEHQARFERLPKLRDCLEAIATLYERSQKLETGALCLLYQREEVEWHLFGPELESIADEARKLQWEVFRQAQGNPEDVIMAFFSEDRETLFDFAGAYERLGKELGKIMSLDYYVPPPAGRSSASAPVRETPKKPAEFWASPPQKVIGIVMHLRGDLFFPRFQDEAGVHKIKRKDVERFCLVETGSMPFDKYEPPEGTDRAGTIKKRSTDIRRIYDWNEKILRDPKLGQGPWREEDLKFCIAALLEERLNQVVEAMLER
jgi:ATP-dependent Clp protease ATP-binding subunit ClpC